MTSERWRLRWAARLQRFLGPDQDSLFSVARYLLENTGCYFNVGFPAGTDDFITFARGLSWDDVLAVSTCVYRYYIEKADEADARAAYPASTAIRRYANEWRDWLAASFVEENLAYEVDEKCGVHFKIDSVFADEASGVLLGLSSSKYKAAQRYAQSAIKFITAAQPDTENAVVEAFKAVETVAKLMAKGAGLNGKMIDDEIGPLVVSRYGGDIATKGSTTKLLLAFKAWADAAHFYRHAQGVATHSPPPIELAILLVSGAFTWLRFLLSLDASSNV